MVLDANSIKMANDVQITVDGRSMRAPEGGTLLQAMLDAGIDVPHYCYHPKLSIDGSCRLCSVKIEGMPKLQIACNTAVRAGMVVHTDDPDVAETRRGVLELLLLNHPLDCPICDKSGECWLQNYSMRFGSRIARTIEPRRKHGKRLDIGERMLLDQERCILCRRCVRFCREISGTGELVIFNRGDRCILDIADRRLDNAYSMCTSDICPVGALETKDFHHRLRVWFFTETASVCPGCANGCNIMIDECHNQIWRLMPRRNDAVNDTWMCDAGRLNYRFVASPARLRQPLALRDGTLAPVSWSEAIERAAAELIRLRDAYGGDAIGALVSPHLTVEENFRFGELLHTLGVSKIAMAVPHGPADDFLIKAEKAANARGVRELGLAAGPDDGLASLIGAAQAGRIKALYVCGGDVTRVLDEPRLTALLERLELLIVQTLEPVPAFAHAAVTFPATTFAEKSGVFINFAGRAQRILAAIEPPPGWLNDGEIFSQLLNAIASRQERFDPETVWLRIVESYPQFSGLSLQSLGSAGAILRPAVGAAPAQVTST
jgi:NADH-quinone oxidoreductase subunit G